MTGTEKEGLYDKLLTVFLYKEQELLIAILDGDKQTEKIKIVVCSYELGQIIKSVDLHPTNMQKTQLDQDYAYHIALQLIVRNAICWLSRSVLWKLDVSINRRT